MATEYLAFSTAKRCGLVLLAILQLAGCASTSGSDRLDETGERLAPAVTEPETSAYYIQALNGGLVSRISGLKLSSSDRARALEAEYKVLEAAPSGQSVTWQGAGGVTGEVMAAVPYQVGSQNCRQYTHTVAVKPGAAAMVARGAACRNANGSWSPL